MTLWQELYHNTITISSSPGNLCVIWPDWRLTFACNKYLHFQFSKIRLIVIRYDNDYKECCGYYSWTSKSNRTLEQRTSLACVSALSWPLGTCPKTCSKGDERLEKSAKSDDSILTLKIDTFLHYHYPHIHQKSSSHFSWFDDWRLNVYIFKFSCFILLKYWDSNP